MRIRSNLWKTACANSNPRSMHSSKSALTFRANHKTTIFTGDHTMQVPLELQNFLMFLLQALIAAVLPVIVYYVRQWAMARVAEIESRLGSDRMFFYYQLAALVVRAA